MSKAGEFDLGNLDKLVGDTSRMARLYQERDALQERLKQAEERVRELEGELKTQGKLWGLVRRDLDTVDDMESRVPFMILHDPIGRLKALLKGE